jgi:hypothetical protein
LTLTKVRLIANDFPKGWQTSYKKPKIMRFKRLTLAGITLAYGAEILPIFLKIGFYQEGYKTFWMRFL